MSSVKSAPITLSSEALDPLIDAATRVCETSFFAFVEPSSSELRASAALEPRWYHTSVDYDGPLRGSLAVALPEGLAREVFAAFLGFADSWSANQAEIEDVVGEFANMVCGAWLTSLGGDSCFTLSHPEVSSGGLPVLDDMAIMLAVNDRPVVIQAQLT